MDKKARALRDSQVWILLGCIAFLSVAFLCFNFHVAASNTQIKKNITTTGIGEGLPNAMQSREQINLSPIGEGLLIGALQKALVIEMKNAGLGEIQLVQGIEPRYPTPALIVKAGNPGLVWTPFFATCRVTVQAGYSSSGDTTFMRTAPATIDNQDGPALVMYSEYQISDRSWGLISRPGYHQMLAKYVAHEIIAVLKDLYTGST